MISFIWKYRFSLIFLLFILFCLSLSVLKNPKIYFDTERILEMSSEEKDVIDESIDDKNLLLASIRFKKETTAWRDCGSWDINPIKIRRK